MMKKIIISLLCVFITNYAFAEFVCGEASVYRAIYDINSYTCAPGEFLPANTLGCVSCPNGFTCPGGTFNFDPDNIQGIYITSITGVTNNVCADNLNNLWLAIYEPNQHTCATGYYMPANYDGCAPCPADSYCPGGHYTFNETTPQGITACAVGLYAPAGMWEPEQCGRILHVGENVLYLRANKKTTHAVHFDVDGDGVADYFANMTTADVPMHAGTTRKLKVQFAGQTYSVYDDTVNAIYRPIPQSQSRTNLNCSIS